MSLSILMTLKYALKQPRVIHRFLQRPKVCVIGMEKTHILRIHILESIRNFDCYCIVLEVREIKI